MCFPSNLSSSSFESDLEQGFFFGEVGELAEVAPYDDSFEPFATEEEDVSNNTRMDQEAEQISQLSQITNTEILPIIQQESLLGILTGHSDPPHP